MNMNNFWFEFYCPQCGYQNDAQIFDIKYEANIFCSNCKLDIQLKDENVSVQSEINKIDSLMNDLNNFFK